MVDFLDIIKIDVEVAPENLNKLVENVANWGSWEYYRHKEHLIFLTGATILLSFLWVYITNYVVTQLFVKCIPSLASASMLGVCTNGFSRDNVS